nr:hypothetical protein [Nocardia vaccinii]
MPGDSGGVVLFKAGQERPEFGRARFVDLLDPAIELLAVVFGHQLGELADQTGNVGHLRACSDDLVEVFAAILGQVGWSGQDPACNALGPQDRSRGPTANGSRWRWPARRRGVVL